MVTTEAEFAEIIAQLEATGVFVPKSGRTAEATARAINRAVDVEKQRQEEFVRAEATARAGATEGGARAEAIRRGALSESEIQARQQEANRRTIALRESRSRIETLEILQGRLAKDKEPIQTSRDINLEQNKKVREANERLRKDIAEGRSREIVFANFNRDVAEAQLEAQEKRRKAGISVVTPAPERQPGVELVAGGRERAVEDFITRRAEEITEATEESSELIEQPSEARESIFLTLFREARQRGLIGLGGVPAITKPLLETKPVQITKELIFGDVGKRFTGLGFTPFGITSPIPQITLEEIRETLLEGEVVGKIAPFVSIETDVFRPLGINIPLSKEDLTTREILRREGTVFAGQILGSALPTTPAGVGIAFATPQLFRLISPVTRGLTLATTTTLSIRTALDEDLPVEERAAAGIFATLGATALFFEVRPFLRGSLARLKTKFLTVKGERSLFTETATRGKGTGLGFRIKPPKERFIRIEDIISGKEGVAIFPGQTLRKLAGEKIFDPKRKFDLRFIKPGKAELGLKAFGFTREEQLLFLSERTSVASSQVGLKNAFQNQIKIQKEFFGTPGTPATTRISRLGLVDPFKFPKKPADISLTGQGGGQVFIFEDVPVRLKGGKGVFKLGLPGSELEVTTLQDILITGKPGVTTLKGQRVDIFLAKLLGNDLSSSSTTQGILASDLGLSTSTGASVSLFSLLGGLTGIKDLTSSVSTKTDLTSQIIQTSTSQTKSLASTDLTTDISRISKQVSRPSIPITKTIPPVSKVSPPISPTTRLTDEPTIPSELTTFPTTPTLPPTFPTEPTFPPSPPARPPTAPPTELGEPFIFDLEKQLTKQLARQQGWDVFIKSTKTKKFVKANTNSLSKTDARDMQRYLIDTSLSRSGKLKPSRNPPKSPQLDIPFGYGEISSHKFRDFKQVKGKRIKLEPDFVIEKGQFLLDTRQEVNDITIEKRLAELKKNIIKEKTKQNLLADLSTETKQQSFRNLGLKHLGLDLTSNISGRKRKTKSRRRRIQNILNVVP